MLKFTCIEIYTSNGKGILAYGKSDIESPNMKYCIEKELTENTFMNFKQLPAWLSIAMLLKFYICSVISPECTRFTVSMWL